MIKEISVGVMIICLISLGWLSNSLYQEYSNNREINGLWIPTQDATKYQVEDYAQSRESSGEWICVNIKGMTMKEVIDTCNHEAGHEIFARYCENNIDKCLEVKDE